jgi:hypothetical protein
MVRDRGSPSHLAWFSPAARQTTPAHAAQDRDDRYAELERLASLHDRGVLTDAEFTSEKARVLATTSM